MLLLLGIVLVAGMVTVLFATMGDRGPAIGDWHRRRGAHRGAHH